MFDKQYNNYYYLKNKIKNLSAAIQMVQVPVCLLSIKNKIIILILILKLNYPH
jgi:hypothetical protein